MLSTLKADHITAFSKLLHGLAQGRVGELVVVVMTQLPGQPKPKIWHKRFPIGASEAMAKFVSHHAAEPYTNLFYSLAVFKPGSGRDTWGDGRDIVACLGLVVDEDADTGKHATLPLPPSLKVQTSSVPAQNWHHIYFLNRDCQHRLEEIDRLGSILRTVTGADSASGVLMHLYRFPGTLNHPTPKKIERGRPPTPQPVTLVPGSGEFIAISDLEKACEKASAGAGNLPAVRQNEPFTEAQLAALSRRDIDGDRSPAAWAAICKLRDDGFDHQQIKNAVLAYPNGVGHRYLSDSKKLDADIRRAFKKGSHSLEPFNRDPSAVLVPNEDIHEDQSGLALGFRRRVDGRIFAGQDPICSPLRVVSRTASEESDEWALLVEIETPDRLWKQVVIPQAHLHNASGDRDPLQVLAAGGLRFYAPRRRTWVRELLMAAEVDTIRRSLKRPGWHGNQFALPNRVIGPEGVVPFIWAGDEREKEAFSAQGDINQWREKVAAPISDQHLLVTAVSASLVSTLLHLVRYPDGFGLHFHGPSSSGKTTLAEVAASVWGPPEQFVKTWRATSNGLEATAASRSDTLLVLDELKQVDPKEADYCTYMLAQGKGKQRASRAGGLRSIHVWRLCFLSTGEMSMANYLRSSASRRAFAGQQMRVLDLPCDHKEHGLGIFDSPGAHQDCADFATYLKGAARKYYGTAGPAFIEYLVNNREHVVARIDALRSAFCKAVGPTKLEGQVSRALDHFSMVFAAGALAVEAQVFPFSETQVLEAVKQSWSEWIGQRGGHGSFEELEAIQTVRAFIEGQPHRFVNGYYSSASAGATAGIPNRAGVRLGAEDGSDVTFAFLPEVWKSEICKGANAEQVARWLRDRGWLLGESGKLQRKVKIDGVRVRMYCVSAKILSDE